MPRSNKSENAVNEESVIWYVALHNLLLPNSPGAKPSSLRITQGQRFQLDGDEPVDVEALLRTGAIKVYNAKTDEAWVGEMTEKRRAAASKPRLRRSS